jgi:hypothetical protein
MAARFAPAIDRRWRVPINQRERSKVLAEGALRASATMMTEMTFFISAR